MKYSFFSFFGFLLSLFFPLCLLVISSAVLCCALSPLRFVSGTKKNVLSVFIGMIVRIFIILIFNVWPTANNYEPSSFTNY
jgi:energy-coupling factor transporter transmembrane protein EcfT